MKKFQFYLSKEASLSSLGGEILAATCDLNHGKEETAALPSVFHMYSDDPDASRMLQIRDMIHQLYPSALVCGGETDGNIYRGGYQGDGIVIDMTVFERPSSRVEMECFQMPIGHDEEVSHQITDHILARPWIKGAEILIPLQWRSMTAFLGSFDRLPEDIELFGGGVFSGSAADGGRAYVVGNSGPVIEEGLIVVLYGGDDLEIRTDYLIGWQPLGKRFEVDDADGPVLKTLDGESAFSIYNKYLRVERDDFTFTHALEFPFRFTGGEVDILRAPVDCLPDGSLAMSSDVPAGMPCQISYGDPATILAEVERGGRALAAFSPQAITLYSCAARRTFWGNKNVSQESLPFEGLAPTTGFYTSGELLRKGAHLTAHNMTLVIQAMKERGTEGAYAHRHFDTERGDFPREASMIARLASFVSEVTKEQEAANRALEEANRQLDELSRRDGLTGLFNRREIQGRFTEAFLDRDPRTICAIMMDIDDFKRINDTYGHNEGDEVLIRFSRTLTTLLAAEAPEAAAGRWGGEEFMVYLPDADPAGLTALAEKIRAAFEALTFPLAGHQTISLGASIAREGESADGFLGRCDTYLYEAKKNGKNQVVFYK